MVTNPLNFWRSFHFPPKSPLGESGTSVCRSSDMSAKSGRSGNFEISDCLGFSRLMKTREKAVVSGDLGELKKLRLTNYGNKVYLHNGRFYTRVE